MTNEIVRCNSFTINDGGVGGMVDTNSRSDERNDNRLERASKNNEMARQCEQMHAYGLKRPTHPLKPAKVGRLSYQDCSIGLIRDY